MVKRTLTYIHKHMFLYLLVLGGAAFMILFSYVPMYGLTLAFKDLNFSTGIWGSPWVGWANFEKLFNDKQFWQVMWNTVLINLYNILFGFTFIIFLALMLNEMKCRWIKSVSQTFVYLPYFISWVVFSGLVTTFLSPEQGGFVNDVIVALGGERVNFLGTPAYFRTILVVTNTIKTAGYNTIIYLAAMAGVNPELYESAEIDGANRFHMMVHITLPRIYPTIAVLLILQLAALFSSNFDQVFNLYNPTVYETGDVVSTYMWRIGLQGAKFEEGTAMGLMLNLFNLITIVVANKFISKLDVMGIF